MSAKDKKKVKKRIKSLKLALIFAIVVYLGYNFISQQVQINALNNDISELDAQILEEESRKKELEKKKKEIDTPEYIEKIAREELDLVAPDEIVFMEAPKNN